MKGILRLRGGWRDEVSINPPMVVGVPRLGAVRVGPVLGAGMQELDEAALERHLGLERDPQCGGIAGKSDLLGRGRAR